MEYVATDVTSPVEVRAAVERAAGTDHPLRTVVNCAGIGPSARILGKKGVHDLDLYAKVVQINLVGTFNVLALASEAIAQTEADEHGQRGVIVNTASIAAFDGQVGQLAYSASKGAVVGMTLPAARDLSVVGIRVVTIAPGLFDTPLLGMLPEAQRHALGESVLFPKRLGDPARYAQLVVDIARNSYLNAEVIRLDGGIRMPPK